ncbi:hypothetical protein [[Mycobacterium] crassicus]|uniref:Uncharacterized protein n=1 Tax=[Mycobacterium] crassicus TaxID=2872309 RepID=A0ABU5XIB3_9MYCO|nr:hypothetical protein [Mycolicibacter sp. MYC098]MEB3021864.1 hypothetical protein [Mycolicibacter sp. MYC098]
MGAASAFAAVILPMAAANAAGDSPVPGWGGTYDSCNGAVCLVMEPLTRASVESDWKYSGIRPWITDWKGDQAYNVQYTANDGTVTDAGSYNIKIEDYWNSLFSSSAYQFGDFVANPDAPEGLNLGDFGDLSGASMYKVTIGDFTNLTLNGVGAHDLNYWVMSYGNTDYTVVTDPNAGISQAYLQIGDAAPQFLWNSMFHDWFAPVPDYLIPNDPFAALDFNPCDYVGGCDVPL